jgi:hypothetical protein
MVNKKIVAGLTLALIALPQGPSAFANAKAGAKCTKAGAKATTKGVEFTCVKKGTKLVWSKSTTSATKESVNQSNARKKAASYLSLSAFSRSGLIKQLEYEGYSNADAIFGTDAQNADWNKQAAKAAASYLALTPFSRSGLIEQLVFEGYTAEQAASGVASTGLK